MHICYDDILSRTSDEPLWWLDGVPRFSPFKPDDVCVYRCDTILVQTECQGCRKRYDVAIRGAFLKEKIAYMASLDVGDPPHACCHVGATMSSDEVRILEYWKPLQFPNRGWERLPEWERPLIDANLDKESDRIEPVSMRLYGSSHVADWRVAQRDGNFPVMAQILGNLGCELADSVAHMLDAERRRANLERTITELGRARKT